MDKIYNFIGYGWGLLFNLFFASLIYWPLLVLTSSPLISSVSFIAALILFLFGIKRAGQIKVKELEIKSVKVPRYWDGKKIAFISDVHLGKTLDHNFLKKVVTKVNQTESQLLLIGGDLFDSTHADWLRITEPLDKLNVNDIFYVTGNHEYYINFNADLKPILDMRGVNLLDSSSEEIKGLVIAGIPHSLSNINFDFKTEIAKINLSDENFNILLYHEPNPLHSEYALANGVDLQLSGHTHFGQLAPFNILTWLYYGHFDYGLYFDKTNSSHQYTSSGVGSWGPPIRTTARPEVVVIKLSNKI
jgi:predicted MPP superfamily phosphohydrolase